MPTEGLQLRRAPRHRRVGVRPRGAVTLGAARL